MVLICQLKKERLYTCLRKLVFTEPLLKHLIYVAASTSAYRYSVKIGVLLYV